MLKFVSNPGVSACFISLSTIAL